MNNVRLPYIKNLNYGLVVLKIKKVNKSLDNLSKKFLFVKFAFNDFQNFWN